jgi:hypothetical protein
MAKRETVTESPTTDLANVVPSLDAYNDVLKKYGVTPDEMYAPPAPTVYKSNLRMLAKLTTPLYDNDGQAIQNVIGHTGPLMFLGKKGEVTPKESRYSGYDGFYIYAVLHPKHGESVVTIGRPIASDDKELPIERIIKFLDSLKPGAWFQIAEIKTGSGFGTYIVVPVQRSS